MVRDYFSKLMEAYPLPDQEILTVATARVDNWISRFGRSLEFHLDQGHNFESQVFAKASGPTAEIEKYLYHTAKSTVK